jgi:hypothetical protein
MGDTARHRVFADYIAERWPDRTLRIADVAGGHGSLNAELYRRGYRTVTTFDKRRGRWTDRKHYRYGHFTVPDAAEFDLLVGMHPDEATDVILAASGAHHVPAVVVPCCPRPTVWDYTGRGQDEWIAHLRHRSGANEDLLPMRGANRVLVAGGPQRPCAPIERIPVGSRIRVRTKAGSRWVDLESDRRVMARSQFPAAEARELGLALLRAADIAEETSA